MGAYASPMFALEPLIDEDGSPATIPIEGHLKGRLPRDYEKVPHGALEGAMPFPSDWYIDEANWPSIIQERDAAFARVSDRLRNSLPYIPSLDQDGTNYCWCNAVVGCVQAVRAGMNEPYVPLSACSVAAIVKGYSNQGGWGGEALKYIVDNGIAPLEMWPNSTSGIRRTYDNADTKAARVNYKVTEWWDLKNGDFKAVMSCILRGIPVAIGLDWWGHEVMACDGVLLNQSFGRIKELQQSFTARYRYYMDRSKYAPEYYDMMMDSFASQIGVRFRNSWRDTYGDKGFGTLTRSKATPDDACAPRVALAA